MGKMVRPRIPASPGTKPARIPFLATLLVAGLALHGTAFAEQSLELKGTTITGDPGLPKVLYIVPWKRPKLNNLDQGLILHSLADYVLEPVDPGLLEREKRYDSVYFSATSSASSGN